MRIGEKLHVKSLSFRIICTVILGILSVALAITVIIINISKNIFVDTYGKSQEKVFLQIEEELNQYHENLMSISSAIDSSWAFRLYFGNNKDISSQLSFQTVYQMQRDISESLPSNISDMSVMVIGMEGQTYINRAETIILENDEILASEAAQAALLNPQSVQYVYATNGFTSTTRNSPVIIGARALTYLDSGECYAIVFFTMKETDVAKFYNYFVSDSTSFYLLDGDDNRVMTSDKKATNGKNLDTSWILSVTEREGIPLRKSVTENGEMLSVMQVYLPYYNCMAYGVIDNDKALDKLYDIPQMVTICMLISIAVLFVIFILVRQTTRPLSTLAGKMSEIRGGDFNQYAQVSGPEEVQELATTYNYMLRDLQSYVDRLLQTQQEKRKSEIKALQMQINPHYVYNTLASIKWLIWQGDAEKSTKTIDAFILLLRNTISNTDEFITVNQEIENLKNYILINNTRYGEKVQVEFYVISQCESFLLPKMMLQPFIENVFFHAFPGDRGGTIQVFFSRSEGNLKIRISDDGVGMNQERLHDLTNPHRGRDNSEHYSGIGINNVDERLKLIYGADYGVTITSKENQGTSIQILIPVKEVE